MITELTSPIFTGKITTLEHFIQHCAPFIDDRSYSLAANTPPLNRKRLLDEAYTKRRLADIKFRQVHVLDEPRPYAPRVNGQRETGLRNELKIQKIIVDRFVDFLHELKSRPLEYQQTYEHEFVKEVLVAGLATAMVPLPRLNDLEELSEIEAKQHLLLRINAEIMEASEFIDQILTATDEELREVLLQHQLREARLRPFDIDMALGLDSF